MANLRSQFEQALTNIEINGQKRKRAIDAHTEIRELLQQDEQLKEWGRRAAADWLLRSGNRDLSGQGRGCLLALYQAGHEGRAKSSV